MHLDSEYWVDVQAQVASPGVAAVSLSEQRHLRNALGCFPTGVAVITTTDETGKLYGVTVSSFNSVSLNPPMVLWSQLLSAPSHPVFRKATHFGVNVLGNHQQFLSERFSRPSEDKFSGLDYFLTPEQVPLLTGVAAHFVCRNEFSNFGGDHTVFFGSVVRFGYCQASVPLIFSRGAYLTQA